MKDGTTFKSRLGRLASERVKHLSNDTTTIVIDYKHLLEEFWNKDETDANLDHNCILYMHQWASLHNTEPYRCNMDILFFPRNHKIVCVRRGTEAYAKFFPIKRAQDKLLLIISAYHVVIDNIEANLTDTASDAANAVDVLKRILGRFEEMRQEDEYKEE